MIFDLVYTKNLVYFCQGFSGDLKPVNVVNYKVKTEKPIVVLKPHKNV